MVGVGEREYWLIRGVEGSGREKILANLGEWGEKGGVGVGERKYWLIRGDGGKKGAGVCV